MILILQENKISFQFLSKQIFIEQLTIFGQVNSYPKTSLTKEKWICYTSNVGKVDKKGFENLYEIKQLAFFSKLRNKINFLLIQFFFRAIKPVCTLMN